MSHSLPLRAASTWEARRRKSGGAQIAGRPETPVDSRTCPGGTAVVGDRRLDSGESPSLAAAADGPPGRGGCSARRPAVTPSPAPGGGLAGPLAHALVSFVALAAIAAPALAQQARDGGAGRQRDIATDIQRRTSKLYRESGPAVASVRVVTRAATRPRLVLPGLTLATPGGRVERVDASCFLVTTSGHVVTTSAVLFDAALIEVQFSDGTVRDADLVGVDGPFQLAVLRTRAPERTNPLCVPDKSDRHSPALGWFFQSNDGRPAVRYAQVQAAAACATPYDRYLTMTFALQPGAAGGPLVSADGRLMGMAVREVRHRAARSNDDGTTGTGSERRPRERVSAAPSTLFIRGADVHAAVEQIVRFGRVRRPLLGVVMDDSTNRIDQLLPGGPAQLAGLAEGDQVIGIGGTRVESLADVTRVLLRRAIGETVVVDIQRGESRLKRPVKLADLVMPPLPKVAPLQGAELQVARDPGVPGQWTVTITDLVAGSPWQLAGARVGDRLTRVDGRDALRFLQRHRIRPANASPRMVEIERAATRHELTLGE